MTPLSKKAKTLLILPLSLLLINAVETVIEYKILQCKLHYHIQTLIMVLLYSVGFAIAATIITPWIRNFFVKAHRSSKKEGGTLGIIMFYALAYLMIYIIYLTIYTDGPQYLLPKAWR